jgi:hypothetical protein
MLLSGNKSPCQAKPLHLEGTAAVKIQDCLKWVKASIRAVESLLACRLQQALRLRQQR